MTVYRIETYYPRTYDASLFIQFIFRVDMRYLSFVHREILCHSKSFLVAQLVTNPPAMLETLVQFLGWEDPLEKGYAAHSSILGLPWWLRQ